MGSLLIFNQSNTPTLNPNTNLKPKKALPKPISTSPTLPLFHQCTSISQLKQIHAQIIRNGLDSSLPHLAIFSSQPKFANIPYALSIFNQIPQPGISVWNSLIRAFAFSNSPSQAIFLYTQMLESSILPDNYTFPFIFKACTALLALEQGKQFHTHSIKSGFDADVFVRTTLFNFYAGCGALDDAHQVFDKMTKRDLVSWNSMIAHLSRSRMPDLALEVFGEMNQRGDVRPDLVTMVVVLSACGQLGMLGLGRIAHGYARKEVGVEENVVLSNVLIDMYAKCGNVEDASLVFDLMSKKDRISWNSIICGYTDNGFFDEALGMFRMMLLSDVRPDEVTMVGVLSACAHLGALEEGNWIRVYIDKNKLMTNAIVATSLIEMYSKCGDIEKAFGVFDNLSMKDILTWNAMIGGFSIHGLARDALNLFEQMRRLRIRPTPVTFIAVLCACSHGGLVKEGQWYFDSMLREYGIEPNIKHYGCMVDLFGRAGLLNEAQQLIDNMPFEPDSAILGALLSSCKAHRNVELGEIVGRKLLHIDPLNSGNYVLLSSLYASVGRWEECAEVRKMMNDNGVNKVPGWSKIEVENVVDEFVAGDQSHPRKKQIYEMLDEIVEKLRLEGYSPDTKVVLFDIDEEEKQNVVGHHSEKLAVAFGLLTAERGKPIRVIKNLRMCHDCHTAIKLISKLYSREIIVRDRLRFHHFEGGWCSCKDYW